MPIFRSKFSILPGFILLLAFCILLLPFRWVMAWLIAAATHELCHYLTLALFRVRIYSVRIGISGALIQTDPMPPYQEAITALAGPAGGLCLLLLARNFPYVAICGLLQSIFNLIPVYPLDGGRVLRCMVLLLVGYNGADAVCNGIEGVVIAVMVAAGCVLSFTMDLGPVPALFATTLLVRNLRLKIPCKRK